LLSSIHNLSAKYFNMQAFEIDFSKMKGGYTKVFYYDALPIREREELEEVHKERIREKTEFLDRVAAVDGVHVYEGDARKRRRRGLEQKKVDVMLTVDLLTHTFRKNMHRATLLTGDNDFKPLVDTVVQDGMYITLWYPPDETSRELIHSADASKKLSMNYLKKLMTEESAVRFNLPDQQNHHGLRFPSLNPREIWGSNDRKKCMLYENNGEFIATKEQDKVNTLHITHKNLDLLRYYCKESLDINVPET